MAALNLLDTAKPELLGEWKQGAAAVRDNMQDTISTLLPAPLLLMSKASSVSHVRALQRLLGWARPLWSVLLYLLLRTGSSSYKSCRQAARMCHGRNPPGPVLHAEMKWLVLDLVTRL